MLKGECNCGTIAFEVTSKPVDVYVCHCSICRRSSGSNGVAVVIVSNEDFRWVKGGELVNMWQKPGHDWQSSFCQNCGAHLPGVNDESRMYVPAGLLIEDDEGLKVAHHIWVDSKAAWDEIGDKGEQHGQAFEA